MCKKYFDSNVPYLPSKLYISFKNVTFFFVLEPYHFQKGTTLYFQSKLACHLRFLESCWLTFDLVQPLTQASSPLTLQWPQRVIVPNTPHVVVLEWGCLNLNSSFDTSLAVVIALGRLFNPCVHYFSHLWHGDNGTYLTRLLWQYLYLLALSCCSYRYWYFTVMKIEMFENPSLFWSEISIFVISNHCAAQKEKNLTLSLLARHSDIGQVGTQCESTL